LRVSRDSAGRWHVAFAFIPPALPGPGTGEVVGSDRGVKVSAALSTGEMLSTPGLTSREAARLLRLERTLARGKRGSQRRAKAKRQKARMNAISADRRRDWVEKTSTDIARRFDLIRVEDLKVREIQPQRCSACGYIATESRESQAAFRCVTCGFACNADVNAAKIIAAGHAVNARGGDRNAGPANREPQLALQV
jgi:transposase